MKSFFLLKFVILAAVAYQAFKCLYIFESGVAGMLMLATIRLKIKMRILTLTAIIFILIFTAKSEAQNITYNHIIDSTDSEVKLVMKLFEDYITSKSEYANENPFWNQQEQKQHKDYDFLESEFQPSLYMGFPVHVLSIKSKDNVFEIKAQFGMCQENQELYVLAIVNYYAKKENGKYKLYNALSINREKWNHRRVGYIDFYYPLYHKFNKTKAKKLNEFIGEISDNFDVKPIPIEYYFADDFDEVQELKGVDYYIGMGGEIKPSGRAGGDKVYSGGMEEYYPHEVFHVQIDAHYPDKYYWVSEGLATLLGGSRGKPLEWHLKRTNEYLERHPEVDLNNLLELVNLDEYTDYHYSLGGLIVKLIYEKGGWKMVKEFMRSGNSEENYYLAIEKHLGVKRDALNAYLRKKLKEQTNE